MPRRLFDVIFSCGCLILVSPIMLLLYVALFLQDFHSPVYRSTRIGLKGRPFVLLKFRSMVIDSHKLAIDTTSANDPRLTRLGPFIRRFKFDELPQFINVFRGDMSSVGPRPQVPREAALYTEVEKKLFDVPPGITDLSSIVFSDLERIVANEPDADIAYNQLVRPWKSRLGLFYINNRNFALDVSIVVLTALNFISRSWALKLVSDLIQRNGGEPDLVSVAARREPLRPTAPPGSDQIVTTRVPAGVR